MTLVRDLPPPVQCRVNELDQSSGRPRVTLGGVQEDPAAPTPLCLGWCVVGFWLSLSSRLAEAAMPLNGLTHGSQGSWSDSLAQGGVCAPASVQNINHIEGSKLGFSLQLWVSPWGSPCLSLSIL